MRKGFMQTLEEELDQIMIHKILMYHQGRRDLHRRDHQDRRDLHRRDHQDRRDLHRRDHQDHQDHQDRQDHLNLPIHLHHREENERLWLKQ